MSGSIKYPASQLRPLAEHIVTERELRAARIQLEHTERRDVPGATEYLEARNYWSGAVNALLWTLEHLKQGEGS